MPKLTTLQNHNLRVIEIGYTNFTAVWLEVLNFHRSFLVQILSIKRITKKERGSYLFHFTNINFPLSTDFILAFYFLTDLITEIFHRQALIFKINLTSGIPDRYSALNHRQEMELFVTNFQ